jgi:hypothetical protein
VRKKVMAVVFAVLAFSLIAASAATLGGISTDDVGADAALVASCDIDGVSVSFGTPTYNGTTGDYEVDTVTVTGIDDDCLGDDISVALTDGSLAALGEGSGNVAVGTADNNTAIVNIAPPADAEAVTRVVVTITG